MEILFQYLIKSGDTELCKFRLTYFTGTDIPGGSKKRNSRTCEKVLLIKSSIRSSSPPVLILVYICLYTDQNFYKKIFLLKSILELHNLNILRVPRTRDKYLR